MEMMSERLWLIKERHRELILKRHKQSEQEINPFYDWDEDLNVIDDAVLARELRRHQDELEE